VRVRGFRAMDLKTSLLPEGLSPAKGSRVFLLVSHAATKLGSKSWEFATPLLLLNFSPGSLFAPTFFGLIIYLLHFFVGPFIGSWMDRTHRLKVVRVGIALQTVGVGIALAILPFLAATAGSAHPPLALLLGAMICCGCFEKLGAMISSVAVKRDWVPALWSSAKDGTQLTELNADMANIDLAAEMLGPLAAGVVLQVSGSLFGFALIGIANVLSFGVELALLNHVYTRNELLQATKAVSKDGPKSFPWAKAFNDWPTFARHPSGVPLLVASYALLYFTVLSPHGVVLTAYLQTRRLSPTWLSAFRAAGAASGMLGMWAFRIGGAMFGPRGFAFVQISLLGVCVFVASIIFGVGGIGAQEGGASAAMLVFLAAVVVSRFGLYGFDVALLTLEQMNVDERHRGLVGAVESSLCALGTMCVFLATLWTASTDATSFGVLVYLSAGFVCLGAMSYGCWCLCWREHAHAHDAPDAGPPPAESAVRYSEHGVRFEEHAHTLQQERELAANEPHHHTHLYYDPPWARHK